MSHAPAPRMAGVAAGERSKPRAYNVYYEKGDYDSGTLAEDRQEQVQFHRDSCEETSDRAGESSKGLSHGAAVRTAGVATSDKQQVPQGHRQTVSRVVACNKHRLDSLVIDLNTENHRLGSQIADLNATVKRLNAVVADRDRQISDLKVVKDHLSSEIADWRTEVKSLTADVSHKDSQIAYLEARIEDMSAVVGRNRNSDTRTKHYQGCGGNLCTV